MYYSAEEIMEMSDEGEPMMVTDKQADKVCREHGVTLADYLADEDWPRPQYVTGFDLGDIAKWLGY